MSLGLEETKKFFEARKAINRELSHRPHLSEMKSAIVEASVESFTKRVRLSDQFAFALRAVYASIYRLRRLSGFD